jgi:hypothetical protein
MISTTYNCITPSIRIMYTNNPFDDANDVQVQRFLDFEWKMVRGYNSMSDDYAYTNAKEYAQRLAESVK